MYTYLGENKQWNKIVKNAPLTSFIIMGSWMREPVFRATRFEYRRSKIQQIRDMKPDKKHTCNATLMSLTHLLATVAPIKNAKAALAYCCRGSIICKAHLCSIKVPAPFAITPASSYYVCDGGKNRQAAGLNLHDITSTLPRGKVN
jgi:hypothetical protein